MRNTEIISNQMILHYRHVSNGGAGGVYAPPVFGRSVNPISTGGAHHPQAVLHAPPDFQTLRHACS